jgi:thiol:disulfide interchange protein DsbG
MRKRILIAALALALVAACGESKQDAAKAPSSQGSSVPAGNVYETVAAKAAGFQVGNMMAAHTVYVFFDSQCPHCAALWRDSKPLLGQTRMIWVPVRLLADISAQQGAMILSASDPVAEMDRNEQNRDAGGKGLQPMGELPKDVMDKVRANTDLWVSIGGGAVPYLVFKNPVTGASSAYEGGMDTDGLKKLLGL